MARLFLDPRLKTLTGLFDRQSPYIVQRDKQGNFYTRRISPYVGGFDDSHWRMFESLLQLKDSNMFLANFEISVEELAEALSERYACVFLPSQVKKWVQKERLDAAQFRDFNAWLKARGL